MICTRARRCRESNAARNVHKQIVKVALEILVKVVHGLIVTDARDPGAEGVPDLIVRDVWEPGAISAQVRIVKDVKGVQGLGVRGVRVVRGLAFRVVQDSGARDVEEGNLK